MKPLDERVREEFDKFMKVKVDKKGTEMEVMVNIQLRDKLIPSILKIIDERETVMSEKEIEDLLGIWNISEELGLRHKLAKAIREEQLKRLWKT